MLDAGAIAGGVIGGVAALTATAIALCTLLRRKRKPDTWSSWEARQEPSSMTEPSSMPETSTTPVPQTYRSTYRTKDASTNTGEDQNFFAAKPQTFKALPSSTDSSSRQALPSRTHSDQTAKAQGQWTTKLAPSSRKYASTYAGLASLMSANPEKAILRRFGDLNLQNLLYLQAQIMELEEELYEVAKIDNVEYTRDWTRLANAEDDRQWDIVLQLRKALCEYNQALKQQTFNFHLQPPHPYDLKVLRKWLRRPGMGEQFLVGTDRHAWDEDKTEDLISLGLQPDDDPLSKWVTDKLMVWVHYIFGRRLNPSALVHYSEDWALRILSLLSTIIASILPIIAIVVLYVVPSTNRRLGILAGFTAIFALILSVVAKAKRSDVFAATAAFAAVQVVFIGTSGPTA